MRRYRTVIVCAVLLVAGALGPVSLRPGVFKAGARAQAAATAVQAVAPAQRRGAEPGQRGETYYWLESRTRRLTTRFGDAVVVVDRAADGDIVSRLNDARGNEIARLRVDRVDALTQVVEYRSESGSPSQAAAARDLRPTLDWAARQIYLLWKDRVEAVGPALEWQGEYMRRRGARPRLLDREIVAVETVWADGLSSAATRRASLEYDVAPGRILRGEAMVSRLTKDGAPAGWAVWFPGDRTFFWKLPGVTEGLIDDKTLARVGGWPFVPDASWLNLQAIAFHHFKQVINTERFVASHDGGMPNRVLRFLTPALSANEPGCDYLHWLDGSIFRYCCDMHDACYEKSGCTASSWWRVWSSWQCNSCNMAAIWCFMTGGRTGFQREP